MTMTLSDLRQKRDANEREEALARNATIREKLVPLLLADLRGELSEEVGLTLLEICDDFEIDETQYADLQKVARAIAQDFARAKVNEEKVEDEKLRFAKFAVGRRRAEQQLLEAELANRRQTKFLRTRVEYARQLAIYADSHQFFFGADGQPLPEVLGLPVVQRQEAAIPKSNCPICLVDFENPNGLEFCSDRCTHIAKEHGEALVQLKILKKKKAVT